MPLAAVDNCFTQVVKLYERCLIACANYPEYWMRYVLCMEACGSMDLSNNALARATQVFVKVILLLEQNSIIKGLLLLHQLTRRLMWIFSLVDEWKLGWL